MKNETIELGDLNPNVVKVLQDLHIDREGQVNLKDALHGIIMLQKQSKNYKRISIAIFTIALIVLFCTFGAAMLAIKLNKDMKAQGDVITTIDGSVLKTGVDISQYTIKDWLGTDDKDQTQLSSITVGDATVRCSGSFLYNGGITFFTPFFNLDLNNYNSSIIISSSYKNDTTVQRLVDYVASKMNIQTVGKMIKILNLDSIQVNTAIRPKSLLVTRCQFGYMLNRYGQCVVSVF